MTTPEDHYPRLTSGTRHLDPDAVDTPAARIRRELSRTPRHPQSADPARAHELAQAEQHAAEQLLAEAVAVADSLNARDDLGRFTADPNVATPATAQSAGGMRPNPAQGSTGSTGSTAQAARKSGPESVLDRIRASAQRQYDADNRVGEPDGFRPVA